MVKSSCFRLAIGINSHSLGVRCAREDGVSLLAIGLQSAAKRWSLEARWGEAQPVRFLRRGIAR